MQQQGESPIRSDDGRWEWDGREWHPTPAPTAAPPPPPAPPVGEPGVPVGTWGATPAPDLPTYTGYMDYPAPQTRGGGTAIASLILGVVVLVAWLLPVLGLPIGAAGLICGILGRRSTRRGLAVAGLVMSTIGLVLAVGNGILGVLVRLSGTS